MTGVRGSLWKSKKYLEFFERYCYGENLYVKYYLKIGMIKFEGCKKHADSVQIDTIICKVMEQEDERQRDRQYDGACGVALRQG